MTQHRQNRRSVRSGALAPLAALTLALGVPGPGVDATGQQRACSPATLGDTILFLRGSPNGWGAGDEYAFTWSCDAYYLNVDTLGRHEFKIADAGWSQATTFGGPGGVMVETGPDATLLANDTDPGRTGNLAFRFEGPRTLRLAFAPGSARPALSVGPPSFRDPASAPVGDRVAAGARFDSRALADKAPFGAQPDGTSFDLSFTAPVGVREAFLVVERRTLEGNQEVLRYDEIARVPLSASPVADERQRWRGSWRATAPGVYGYRFEFATAAGQWVLQNNTAPIYWTRERGAGGPGVVSPRPERPDRLRRFRQTIHAADFRVPDWAQDTVYYYIFPERFRNGDPANDPRPGQARYHDATVEHHPAWAGVPYRPGDGSDALYNNDFFGGDIAGIIEKLDEIADLGANALYITPLLRGASNHKYDTADYRQIDPGFGTNADYARLTREAARRGIRVIADTSFNHVGRDSVYFDRYGNFGGVGAFAGGRINRASPYAGWFRFDETQTDPDRQYRGWTGVADLPETDKSSRGFRDFAYGAPDSITRQWLRAGAAGWRMDVAPWVPDDFWREWRMVVKAENPDALTVAETWFDASNHLLGDTFDTTMNYIFRNAALDFAGGMDVRRVWPVMEHLREAYPPQAFFAMMNLLSTHDQARSLHVLGWHGDRDDREGYRLARQRLLLAMTLQMAWPGSPAIYYGDEVGLGGGDDPMNRLPYPWADQGGAPDMDMHARVRGLVHLRRDHAVLRRGSVGPPVLLTRDAVAFRRSLDGREALIVLGNADRAQRLRVPTGLPAGTVLVAPLSGPGRHVVARDGTVNVRLAPLTGLILLNEPGGR